MTDLTSLYDEHKNLSEEAQKKAGQAAGGSMDPKHQAFLDLLLSLMKQKAIDPTTPTSFLNQTIYNALTEPQKDEINLALINLAHMLEDIVEFRLSTETPDSSPQLQTMIEQLWVMKERMEEKVGDVFKF